MQIRRFSGLLVPLVTIALAAGCRSCHERRPAQPSCASCPQRCNTPTQPEVRLSPSPLQGPVTPVTPVSPVPPPAHLPPGPTTPTQPWTPQEHQAETPKWKPVPQEQEREPSAKLYPPESTRPTPTTPPLSIPPRQTQEPPKEQPKVVEKETEKEPSAFPVDIPQFVSVKDRIAAGQKPRPEGVTWLRERGYRTVLYLKAPGEDDAATRRLIESKGLTYQALEVSPETIKQGLVEDFNRQVAAPNALPIFVYDKDGTLAGAVWFLHFQTTDKLNREKALDELTRLGFKPDEEGTQKELWLAVQSYLSMNKSMSWQR